jgi:hypothetical protein
MPDKVFRILNKRMLLHVGRVDGGKHSTGLQGYKKRLGEFLEKKAADLIAMNLH